MTTIIVTAVWVLIWHFGTKALNHKDLEYFRMIFGVYPPQKEIDRVRNYQYILLVVATIIILIITL